MHSVRSWLLLVPPLFSPRAILIILPPSLRATVDTALFLGHIEVASLSLGVCSRPSLVYINMLR